MTTTTMLNSVGLLILTSLFTNSAAQAQEAQSSPPGPPLSDKAKKGKVVFNDYCYRCHQVDSPRAKPLGPMGPELSGLFKKDKLIVGKPVTDTNVKEVIKMGPTPGMPGFRYTLSDHEIGDLIVYLKER